jgi:hypothetical protein
LLTISRTCDTVSSGESCLEIIEQTKSHLRHRLTTRKGGPHRWRHRLPPFPHSPEHSSHLDWCRDAASKDSTHLVAAQPQVACRSYCGVAGPSRTTALGCCRTASSARDPLGFTKRSGDREARTHFSIRKTELKNIPPRFRSRRRVCKPQAAARNPSFSPPSRPPDLPISLLRNRDRTRWPEAATAASAI